MKRIFGCFARAAWRTAWAFWRGHTRTVVHGGFVGIRSADAEPLVVPEGMDPRLAEIAQACTAAARQRFATGLDLEPLRRVGAQGASVRGVLVEMVGERTVCLHQVTVRPGSEIR